MVTSEEKQQILEKIDFRQEYERIGVVFDQTTPGPDGWLQCHAIDREDHSPSAAVNLTNGYYTDLGSGQRFDFFQMMQVKGGYNGFLDVVNHYRQQLGITPPPAKRGPKPKSPEAEVDLLPWDGTGDQWCGLKSTNRSAVERAGGIVCRYKKNHSCIAFQVFATPASQSTQASGYVVVSTDGKELPRFDRSGNTIGTSKCKIVAGTTSGLIGTEAIAAIQQARKDGTLDEITLFKVEGITDMTALLARIPTEKRGKWLVVTNASGASEKPKATWSPFFEGVDVVVIHDCDKPGQDGAATWCSFLKGKAARVRNLMLPFEITPNHGRDLKDFLSEHSIQEFEELVEGTSDANCEKASHKEKAENNPNRIAMEYLQRTRAIEGHPSIFTLVFQQGFFYAWTGGCYEVLPLELLQAELTTFCNTLFYEDYMKELEAWEERHDDTPQPLVRNVTIRLVADVLNEIRAMTITHETRDFFWRDGECPPEYSNPKDLIPVENGIIYLKRLEAHNFDCLLPPTPLYFNRNMFPVRFDPKATAEPWYDLVETSLIDQPGDIAKHNILQEFLGYCLIPDTTLQQFLLMVGEGANGKSAILTAFSTVIGEKNLSNVSLEMFSDKFALGQLRGKCVNIVDDLSETDKICEGKLKSVVAGSRINTDRKNKEAVSFEATTRLIFACNTLPKFQDKSNGIQRRLVLLTFNHQVTEAEKRKEFSLPSFWEQHKSGMLNWLLEGVLRLRRNGYELTRCEEAEKEKQEYLYELNPAASFIAENLIADPNGYLVCSELYKAYTDWCFQNGMKTLNSNNFGRELRRKLKVTKAKRMTSPSQREYAYIGVRFSPDYKGESHDFH